MPNPYEIGADIASDQVLPWIKEDDKKRQGILKLKERMQNFQPLANKSGYQAYADQQAEILNQSNARVQAEQSGAQGRIKRESEDRQRWALDAQKKAQEQLQKQYEDYIKQNPYQNSGSVTYGPGGQVISGGSGGQFAGGGWQSGQQYTGSDVELAQLARAAGFPEDQIPMAVAVALAESGGNASATHGNSNGSMDNGLWQINSVHSGRPGFENVMDPLQNAKLAFQIYKDAGNSWSPWVTAQNGLQNQFMARGQAAIGNPAYKNPWATVPPTLVNSGGTTGLRQTVIAKAMTALGTPYVWGGNSLTQGVDCSGLVQQAYQSVGIPLPRTANELADGTGEFNAIGTRVPFAQLRPGDLVAWNNNRSGQASNFVGHIAIYAGNGEIIEAKGSGIPVHRVRLDMSAQNVYGVHLTLPGD